MAKARKPYLFQSVFGESWDNLPPVMHKHYAHRSHSNDTVVMQGMMQFKASRMAQLLSPILRISGMVPMFTAHNVPVTVQMCSQPDKAAVAFRRVFNLPERKPITFNTVFEPQQDNCLIDWTDDDIGWHTQVSYANRRVTMAFKGYCGRLFGRTFRLPLAWLIGTCTAWEKALDDNRFLMCMEIRRSNGELFYRYEGEFHITGVIRRD